MLKYSFGTFIEIILLLFSTCLLQLISVFLPVSPPGEQFSRCPKLNPMPGCSLGMTGCSGDSECPDGQFCCLQRDCTRQCYAPEKPGQCPVFKRKACPLIFKPDGCSTDWDCAGDRKCCSDGCSKECSSSFPRQDGGKMLCPVPTVNILES